MTDGVHDIYYYMGALMIHKRIPILTIGSCGLIFFSMLAAWFQVAAAQDGRSYRYYFYQDILEASKIYVPIVFSPRGPEWTITTVDSAHNLSDMGDRSLRLTSDDRPRIAYGLSHLYYAHLEDTGWVIDSVDTSSGVGRYASLALDSTGKPYISYFNQSSLNLRVARWDGSAWILQTIDTGNLTYGAGQFTSIAVDPANHIHVAYQGKDYNYSQYKYLSDLKYAYWNGTSWSKQILDNSDNIGGYISLALDPDNHAHISYFDDDYNNNLKYVQYTGSAWFQITFDYADKTGYYSSIAVDKDSHVFISYFDESTDRLKMVSFHNDDLDIKIETVDPKSAAGEYTSIALDSLGRPHIAYYDFFNKDLKYAWWTGSAWVITTVDSSGDVGKYASLALDSSDLAHISYYDYTHNSLKYASQNFHTP